MNKESLYLQLDKMLDNYNQFIISTLYLKNILDKTDDELLLQELEFDVQEILVLFSIDFQKLYKFEKKLNEMNDRYNIKSIEILEQNLEEIKNMIKDQIVKNSGSEE